MKRFVLIICSIILFLCGCVNDNSGENITLSYYDEPGDAINEFFDGLNDRDMDKIINAYGVNIKKEFYNLEAEAERLNIITPSMYLHNSSELYKGVNGLSMSQGLFIALRNLIYSLNFEDDPYDAISIEETDLDIDKFTEEYENLDSIYVQYIYQEESIYTLEDNFEHFERLAKVYEAETIKEYLVVFEYRSMSYIIGITLLEYDDGYIIDGLYASTLGMSYGIPEQIDVYDIHNLNLDENGLKLVYENIKEPEPQEPTSKVTYRALRGTWMNDEETLTFIDNDTYVSNYYYGFGDESTYILEGNEITFAVPLIGNDKYYIRIDYDKLYLYTDIEMTDLDALLIKQ